MNKVWQYWLDGAHSPALNMAFDEALLRYAGRSGVCVLRFYEWDRPSISIGYLQDYAAGEREGFAVVRRPTGGGVVFHDHDLTYTVAIPAEHWICGVDREASYGHINHAVTSGLNQCNLDAGLTDAVIPHTVARRTMICFENPTRYDIVLGGKKVAGAAQRRVREGILHQGSIHFGGPLPVRRHVLIDEIVAGFQREMDVEMAEFEPAAELFEEADKIAAEKYATARWNRKR